MNKVKRRVLRITTAGGLALIVLAYFAFTAVNPYKNTLRLIEVVKQGDKADAVEVRALLAGGADPNAPIKSSSPLTLVEMLRHALHRSELQGHESTIFMFAASHCDDRILRTLLDAGGDIHDQDFEGRNALYCAVGSSHLPNVELLVQRGADVNRIGPTTLLIKAILNAPDAKDVLYLLAHRADPNGCGSQGDSALMQAAGENRLTELQALLRSGAHVNLRDPAGKTALMWAAREGHMEALTLLLKAGGDPTLRDDGGQTAEDFASQRQVQVARFLHNYRPPSAALRPGGENR